MKTARPTSALLIALLLTGCAAAPTPVLQPSAPMSITDARKAMAGINRWPFCDSPSLSCIIFRHYSFEKVAAEADALLLDKQRLPYSEIDKLAIVPSPADNKFAFLILKEGLVLETGYGEKGNRNAQKIADALLTLKQAASPEARATEAARFDALAASYRSSNPKPEISEDVRRNEIQAEDAVRNRQFERASSLYESALQIAPWWPQGHFNRALILESLEQYDLATEEMQRYLKLVPDAPNARAAQDKIYEWQTRIAPPRG